MQKIDYTLRALALEELYAIRNELTDAERLNLNFWALRPGDAVRGLFGQITGKTPNDRSNRLIALALVPLTSYGELAAKHGIQNGPELAVEIYTRQPFAENKKVVEFLQGIRPELTVDEL